MSFYTNNVYTKIYNSVFDQSKYRSEFRLDQDTLFLSNMRILNLGLTSTVGNTKRYNLVNGVGAIIKNIYLYDGSVILDKVINFGDYSAFTAYNKSNQANSDVAKLLARNGLGFVYDRAPNASGAASNNILIKETFPNAPDIPRTSQEETPMGFLSLREIFPLLKGAGGLKYIHTGLFKNLKVVIEYNLPGSLTSVSGEIGDAASTTLPILVADCIQDAAVAAKFLSEFKQQTWISNEVESVVVPASSSVGTQSEKFRLTGALGKTVNYMLVQKKGSTGLSTLYDNHASETMINETFQVRVNGEDILAESGVISSAHRLALLHDTFGVCNTHTCAAELPMYNAAQFIDSPVERTGRLDYFGCTVNQKVGSLDLLYGRQISVASGVPLKYRAAVTLNVFYGIVKAIVKDNKGGYSVMYV
jgi:hypothetical protein